MTIGDADIDILGGAYRNPEILGAVLQPASLSVALRILQAQINGLAVPGLYVAVASLTMAFYLVVPIAVAAIIFRQRDMVGAG